MIGEIAIKVTTEELLEKAAQINRSIDAIRGNFSEMEAAVKRSSGYWLGEAGEKHRRIFNGQKETIAEIMERLSKHVADLRAIAQVYAKAEKGIEQIALDLPSDVIV